MKTKCITVGAFQVVRAYNCIKVLVGGIWVCKDFNVEKHQSHYEVNSYLFLDFVLFAD